MGPACPWPFVKISWPDESEEELLHPPTSATVIAMAEKAKTSGIKRRVFKAPPLRRIPPVPRTLGIYPAAIAM